MANFILPVHVIMTAEVADRLASNDAELSVVVCDGCDTLVPVQLIESHKRKAHND